MVELPNTESHNRVILKDHHLIEPDEQYSPGVEEIVILLL
jgi:hypothetical protein